MHHTMILAPSAILVSLPCLHIVPQSCQDGPVDVEQPERPHICIKAPITGLCFLPRYVRGGEMIMQAFNFGKDLLHRRNYFRRRRGIPDLQLVILISRCFRLPLHHSVEVLVAPEGSAVSGLPIPGKSALCGSGISRLIADPSNPFEAPCRGFVRCG